MSQGGSTTCKWGNTGYVNGKLQCILSVRIKDQERFSKEANIKRALMMNLQINWNEDSLLDDSLGISSMVWFLHGDCTTLSLSVECLLAASSRC